MADLTKRLENFDKESKACQINYNHSDDLLRQFFLFTQMLRDYRNNYDSVQHKNQLVFYMQVFNVLGMDFEFLYYGTISSLPFHQLPNTSLWMDEKKVDGVMKAKPCFTWIEKEWNALENRSFDNKRNYRNAFVAIEALGSNLHLHFLKALKSEVECMEEYGYKIEKGGFFDNIILSIKWNNNTIVAAKDFPSTWLTRLKIIQLITQKLHSSKTSSSNTSSTTVVAARKSDLLINRKQSSIRKVVDEDDKMNSSTTDAAVLSSTKQSDF